MNTLVRSVCLCVSAFLFSLFLVSCSDSGTATVRISLDLPDSVAAQSRAPESIIDRVLGFFSTPAYAQLASLGISSVQVTVSGPGMDTVVKKYSGDTLLVVMAIEEGPQRTIEVSASLERDNKTAVLSYQGSATVDLKAGELKVVAVTMIASDIKLVLPDFSNARLVQIPGIDATDDEWASIGVVYTGTYPSYSEVSLLPYDVDFDAAGRIYMLSSGNGARLLRFNALVALTVAEDVLTDDDLGGYELMNATGIAIDRPNNILYCVFDDAIMAKDLSSGTVSNITDGAELPPALANGATLSDLAVDGDGGMYVAAQGNGGSVPGLVFKYDPEANAVAQYTDPDSGEPMDISVSLSELEGLNYSYNTSAWDITIRGDQAYVAVYDSSPENPQNAVVRFDLNLQDPAVLTQGPGTSPDSFIGPHRFVGWNSGRLFVIDDLADNDRIVGFDISLFDDNSDGGWETYGSTGTLTGQFMFYVNN